MMRRAWLTTSMRTEQNGAVPGFGRHEDVEHRRKALFFALRCPKGRPKRRCMGPLLNWIGLAEKTVLLKRSITV